MITCQFVTILCCKICDYHCWQEFLFIWSWGFEELLLPSVIQSKTKTYMDMAAMSSSILRATLPVSSCMLLSSVGLTHTIACYCFISMSGGATTPSIITTCVLSHNTSGDTDELPAPYHGQAQYSHQIKASNFLLSTGNSGWQKQCLSPSVIY